MKEGLGLGLTLLLCAAANAAEPAGATPNAALPKAAAARPAPTHRLNLRVGDVRKYMMPNDFQAVLSAPDADKTTIVVEGERAPPPLQSERPVPMGLGSLWYAAKNPLQVWRIFAPAVSAPALGPTFDKVPPPIFRWGP